MEKKYTINDGVIIFDDDIKIIDEKFIDKKINKVIFPSNLEKINAFAFSENNIKEVLIPYGTKLIDFGAFYKNPLEIIIIPKTVKEIKTVAFNSKVVIYDRKVIDNKLISRFSVNNIVKVNEALKYLKTVELEKIPLYIFNIIPIDNDSLKGFLHNYRNYLDIINKYNYDEDEKESIFKLCYILGMFHDGKNNDLIKRIIKEQASILNLFENIVLYKHNKKIEDTIVCLYDHNQYIYNKRNIIPYVYLNFNKINEYTLKRHKSSVSFLNWKLKKNLSLDEVNSLKNELNSIKTNLKRISYDDIIYYMENTSFEVSEDCKDLKKILDILSMNINKEDYYKIEKYYRISKNVNKCVPLIKDKQKKGYNYKWLSSSDPINFILGYIVNCCAKINGAGEDIMLQSLINPNVINLVITDEKSEIIAKATAYFNLNYNYILFNTAQTVNLNYENKEKVLNTIIRAINDMVDELSKKGIIIKKVNMGLTYNALNKNIVNDNFKIISDNLLSSVKFNDYVGDSYVAQAILYSNDEKKVKKLKKLDN